MSLIEHAKAELKYSGYIPLDQEQDDSPNKWIQENLLELIEVFSKQGHSGFSASYCIDAFCKLANYKLLSPIKDDSQNDWCETSKNVFQHKRLSALFKDGKGMPYYLDAITWKESNGSYYHGSAHTSNGEIITSRQLVRFPFFPKSSPI